MRGVRRREGEGNRGGERQTERETVRKRGGE